MRTRAISSLALIGLVRFWCRDIGPIQRGVEELNIRAWVVDRGNVVAGACFEQQHGNVRVLRQTIGNDATRRTGADDNIVVWIHALLQIALKRSSKLRRRQGLLNQSSSLAIYWLLAKLSIRHRRILARNSCGF